MTDVRQRRVGENEASESEDDLITEPQESDTVQLPQGSDQTTKALDGALKGLPPRWRNWTVRGIFTCVMLGGFALVIYLGPLALVFVTLALQTKCYHEIVTIGYVVYRSVRLPWFRVLSWFFLFTLNFFILGESMIDYFGLYLSRISFLRPFIAYHRFISFSLYMGGFVAFVFSLQKKHYFKQFTLFGYTHVVLLMIVFQSHLLIRNVLEGFIWVLVPVSMIVCNDITAYIFGFFFGKTPLIKLSPKKTWEGFIGGAISTIIFGVLLSYIMVQFDYFVCPLIYDDVRDHLTMECKRSPAFVLTEYEVGLSSKVEMYPFVLHSIFMSIFAAFIGPMGGFFASGLKRAYKIKDFGDTIPGHGGFVDRFDCQFLMASFINAYSYSFIRMPDTGKLLHSVLMLPADAQVRFYQQLQEKLVASRLILDH